MFIIWRPNIIKMLILLIYRCSTNPGNSKQVSEKGNYRLCLNFIWKCKVLRIHEITF